MGVFCTLGLGILSFDLIELTNVEWSETKFVNTILNNFEVEIVEQVNGR